MKMTKVKVSTKTRDLINGLKQAMDRKGQKRVAKEMGYRSTVALYYWVREGRVPEIARDKLVKFLTKEKLQCLKLNVKSGLKKKAA